MRVLCSTERLVRTVLYSFLTDHDGMENVMHFQELKEGVRNFVLVICQDDTHLSQFDHFSSKLIKMLEKCFFSCITGDACKSKYVQRGKMWTAFHQIRLQEAPKLWEDLFGYGSPKLSPIVFQQVNQKLYSDLINCHLSSNVENDTLAVPVLTSEEENILRYAAGYVPLKLLQQYEKSLDLEETTSGKTECLSAMAVNGEESTLLDHTRKWIDLVNRGGLFDVTSTFHKSAQTCSPANNGRLLRLS